MTFTQNHFYLIFFNKKNPLIFCTLIETFFYGKNKAKLSPIAKKYKSLDFRFSF